MSYKKMEILLRLYSIKEYIVVFLLVLNLVEEILQNFYGNFFFIIKKIYLFNIYLLKFLYRYYFDKF